MDGWMGVCHAENSLISFFSYVVEKRPVCGKDSNSFQKGPSDALMELVPANSCNCRFCLMAVNELCVAPMAGLLLLSINTMIQIELVCFTYVANSSQLIDFSELAHL